VAAITTRIAASASFVLVNVFLSLKQLQGGGTNLADPTASF
jgi:hypothetical protein